MSTHHAAVGTALFLFFCSWVHADISYAPNDDNFHQEQYRDLLEKTRRFLPQAFDTVRRSGLFAQALNISPHFQLALPLIVVIRVIPEESLYHGLEGTAGWRKVDGHWIHELTINIASYMQEPGEDIPLLLAHEMAHIVLADVVGLEGTGAVPMWLNEGLAQSVTDEGRGRVSDYAGSIGWQESQLIPCTLDAPVNTFAHGDGNYACYPEYYLALQYAARKYGPASIGRFIENSPKSHSVRAAFESATSADYAQFQRDVETFMTNVVTGRQEIP
jgi:hypothetical protein